MVKGTTARQSAAMLNSDHRGPSYATAGSSLLAGVNGTFRLSLPVAHSLPA